MNKMLLTFLLLGLAAFCSLVPAGAASSALLSKSVQQCLASSPITEYPVDAANSPTHITDGREKTKQVLSHTETSSPIKKLQQETSAPSIAEEEQGTINDKGEVSPLSSQQTVSIPLELSVAVENVAGGKKRITSLQPSQHTITVMLTFAGVVDNLPAGGGEQADPVHDHKPPVSQASDTASVDEATVTGETTSAPVGPEPQCPGLTNSTADDQRRFNEMNKTGTYHSVSGSQTNVISAVPRSSISEKTTNQMTPPQALLLFYGSYMGLGLLLYITAVWYPSTDIGRTKERISASVDDVFAKVAREFNDLADKLLEWMYQAVIFSMSLVAIHAHGLEFLRSYFRSYRRHRGWETRMAFARVKDSGFKLQRRELAIFANRNILPNMSSVQTEAENQGWRLTVRKNRQPRSDVRLTMQKYQSLIVNSQLQVKVVHPISFGLALDHALQTPRYRKLASWLLERHKLTDPQVRQIIHERDIALSHVKAWEAHHPREIEKASSFFKDYYKKQQAEREAKWQEFHAAAMKDFAKKLDEREHGWREFHTAEMEKCAKTLTDQKASAEKKASAMQMKFNNQLNEEREKTRAAQNAAPVLEPFEQVAWEHKVRDLTNKRNGLQTTLKEVQLGFKIDKEAMDAKLRISQDAQEKLQDHVRKVEAEKKRVVQECESKLVQKDKHLEVANQEKEQLRGEIGLLEAQLQAKEASSVVQIERNAEQTQQGDACRSLFVRPTPSVYQYPSEEKPTDATLPQNRPVTVREHDQSVALEAAEKEINRFTELADNLRNCLQRKENSEAMKDDEIADLTVQIGDLRSTLESKQSMMDTEQQNLEDASKEVLRLKEVAELLRLRVQRKEASENDKKERIADLNRQLEQSKSALESKTMDMENCKAAAEKETLSLKSELQERRDRENAVYKCSHKSPAFRADNNQPQASHIMPRSYLFEFPSATGHVAGIPSMYWRGQSEDDSSDGDDSNSTICTTPEVTLSSISTNTSRSPTVVNSSPAKLYEVQDLAEAPKTYHHNVKLPVVEHVAASARSATDIFEAEGHLHSHAITKLPHFAPKARFVRAIARNLAPAAPPIVSSKEIAIEKPSWTYSASRGFTSSDARTVVQPMPPIISTRDIHIHMEPGKVVIPTCRPPPRRESHGQKPRKQGQGKSYRRAGFGEKTSKLAFRAAENGPRRDGLGKPARSRTVNAGKSDGCYGYYGPLMS